MNFSNSRSVIRRSGTLRKIEITLALKGTIGEEVGCDEDGEKVGTNEDEGFEVGEDVGLCDDVCV